MHSVACQDFGSGERLFWGGAGAEPPPGPGEFSKIFKELLQKIAKMNYFMHIFKKFNKTYVNVSLVFTKNNLLGNFVKLLKIQ